MDWDNEEERERDKKANQRTILRRKITGDGENEDEASPNAHTSVDDHTTGALRGPLSANKDRPAESDNRCWETEKKKGHSFFKRAAALRNEGSGKNTGPSVYADGTADIC